MPLVVTRSDLWYVSVKQVRGITAVIASDVIGGTVRHDAASLTFVKESARTGLGGSS